MKTPELLTCQEVMHLTGIRSRTTIWRRIQKGRFPSPVDLGAGRIRWRAADIAAWISALPLRRY
jgi:prophage regulatory protein